MKTRPESNPATLAFWKTGTLVAIGGGILSGAGCADLSEQHARGSFASVRPVIEANCVHCHGPNRLAKMPAFTDTRSLSRLIGPANWIVPGHPERSRFFQAMPPTGHAISKSEVKKLHAWIAAGAPVPAGPPVVLVARGEGPRSQ
jgi:mono/diheme cytochrome c family protein